MFSPPRILRFLRLRLALTVALLIAIPGGTACIAVWEYFNGVGMDEIRKKGTLKVITAFNANSYFIYKGQPMGYEYELLRLLARDLGVKLEIIVTRDMDNIVYMLNSGRGDLVAANITVNLRRAREVQFSEHLKLTRQVLVQRRQTSSTAKDTQGDKKTADFIRSPVDLIGKTVYVRKRSVFYQRLRNLEKEIGGKINIVTVPGDIITEELIRRVSEGKIDYTIADEPEARINRSYYPNLHVDTSISFPQKIAWVVRNNSPELLTEVNRWILGVKKSGVVARFDRKYYNNPRAHVRRIKSAFYTGPGESAGRISIYDKNIKAAAKSIGWDWRLVASVIYQESRFNAKARSWAGAQGLMQLMPATAQFMKVRRPYDPIQNISGGVRYLQYLEEKRWKGIIKDKNERLKFVLASYNAGPGHVEDARILARKYGDNPDVWDKQTAPYILKLADPRYYNMPEVKKGYCRGQEPYKYVREILERYEQYRKIIKDPELDKPEKSRLPFTNPFKPTKQI